MSFLDASNQPIILKAISIFFIILWCIIACFPLLWITIMSVKLPLDAFDSNFFNVLVGPVTLQLKNGVSIASLLTIILFSLYFYTSRKSLQKHITGLIGSSNDLVFLMVLVLLYIICCIFILITFNEILDVYLGVLGAKIFGFTLDHYYAVWTERGFSLFFKNSLIVTSGVVIISLTLGTLAGYGLARKESSIAFWILIIALIFRALPHSVLVAGYLPFFMKSNAILSPIFGEFAPVLYGQPLAVIVVLVAINQPFTIWLMRSFFQNIPKELDEAARIDGCSHSQAFRKIIIPVMWPGVITTGLFSFMLGYNDYLVCSLLLDGQNQTMVPSITGLFNRDTSTTDEIVAIAAAVSITAPLFLIVLIFQKQIVSGLTAGAVKG
tara:strand:+ start:156 stop:1298 length:1143 start_codon:yes stop_codon:yes gene_type:complete